MSWMIAAVGGSALLGAYQSQKQANAQAKQQQANMMAQAAQTRFSPWTGASIQNMPGQAVDQTAGITGALGGAMTGAQMAAQVKQLRAAQAPQPQTNNPGYSGTAMAGGAMDDGVGNYENPWTEMSAKRAFWKDPSNIA